MVLVRDVSWERWESLQVVGELPSDILNDFRSRQNAVSVWQVNDDLSDVEEVACAFIAGSEKVDHVDFVFVSDGLLDEIGIIRSQVPAPTPYRPELHWDLVGLTATSLFVLVDRLRRANVTLKRVPKDRVLDLLGAQIVQGLSLADLHPRVLDALVGAKYVSEAQALPLLKEAVRKQSVRTRDLPNTRKQIEA